MPKLAYLECPTGIAGDMCLGALVHAGVPLDYLIKQLRLLGISREYQLKSELVYRNGQQATKVHVHLLHERSLHERPLQAETAESVAGVDPHSTFAAHQHSSHATDGDLSEHEFGYDNNLAIAASPADSTTTVTDTDHAHGTRHLPEIEHLIATAALPLRVKEWSLAIFRQLAIAEGAVHGIAPEQVHFHEVGATDAIVDIVGTCLGLDWLGIDQIYCSALPTGGGTVRSAHGQLPVPTPAVLKLWEMRQVPIYSNGIERELVTPTGAAIATTLAVQFGPPPPITLQKVGLGAGSRHLPIPNLLRLWIGEGKNGEGKNGEMITHEGTRTKQTEQRDQIAALGMTQSPVQIPDLYKQPAPRSHGLEESIALLETQIDDLNPQAIGYVYEKLFQAGAVDVFTQAIGMKKSRPGILLSVVCHPAQIEVCEAILFRETTTLGIRRSIQQRSILHRETQTVTLQKGSVHIKIARLQVGGEVINVQPEYEDCAAIARQTGLPWREIHRLALEQWWHQACFAKDESVETELLPNSSSAPSLG